MFSGVTNGVETAGTGLPTGYRDAMFLREYILALSADPHIADGLVTVSANNADGAPLFLAYSKLGASAENLGDLLAIFPVDLERYRIEQIRTWVSKAQYRGAIVVHRQSGNVLRNAGFSGAIKLAPLPCVSASLLPKKHALRLSRIFRYIDSRERQYDPDWLMPEYPQKAAEEPVSMAAPVNQHVGPIVMSHPSMRFRLGATKRHFLNLVAELFESESDVNEPMQDDSLAEARVEIYQPKSLPFDGAVFTTILDEFSDESCWADLVKAFCEAFRFEPNATLVVCLYGDAREQHARDFDHVLCALYPFSCRLILLQMMFDDSEYEELIACTDVYVDVGRRMTLRADQRRFFSAGVLTVGLSPCTDEEVEAAFVDYGVDCCKEPGYCDLGNDPRYQSIALRLSWESLLVALTRAHDHVASTGSADARVYRTCSSTLLEQQKTIWRQALRDTSALCNNELCGECFQLE